LTAFPPCNNQATVFGVQLLAAKYYRKSTAQKKEDNMFEAKKIMSGALAYGLILVLSVPLMAADPAKEAIKKELKADKKEIKSDKKELRSDRKELHQDKKALHEARKEGASKETLKNMRSEIKQDKKEIVQDKKELRSDRKELQSDRKDFNKAK
jgi:uncharacterized protein (DUF3084 family)